MTKSSQLERVTEYVRKHPGSELLSFHGIFLTDYVVVKCGDCGHIWAPMINNLVNMHQWCMKCAAFKRNQKRLTKIGQPSYGEKLCRTIFEAYFDLQKFPTSRPVWLVSPKGRSMELDGYNEKLQIAFEYQGKSHSDPKWFHQGEEKLAYKQSLDAHKAKLCYENNVTLITVEEDKPRLIIRNIMDVLTQAYPEVGRETC